MKIYKVEIANWRSIVHEVVYFEQLMIFIGQNNHGKSNILSSLLFFFGEINAQDLDYCNGSDHLWVEIEFKDLDENEMTTFSKYVTKGNKLKVRKISKKDEGFEYHGYLEEPRELWLREEKISDYTKRDVAKNLGLYKSLPESGRITIEDFKKAQAKYIAENKDKIQYDYKLETNNFLGAKNVAKGIFGDLFFIPSVKKISEELSTRGSSMFNQLYSRVINKMSETDPKFIKAKKQIEELSKILNKLDNSGAPNKNRPKELTDLEKLIDTELKSWNAKIDIEITPPNVDDIFKLGTNVSVDDGVRTDIERKGHGLQRALIFALIKAWAKVIKEERANLDDNKTKEEKSKRKASKSTYFIFEEPELFLHPQAQRELFSSLLALSKEENQIILCTHSSSFLDLDYYKSICIVRKDNVKKGSKILQCRTELFTQTEEKKRFNMSYWINPDRSELFFAKKIILVEGQTESSILPLIAKKENVFKYDFSIIDCGSKSNIPQYINLLNAFKLSYVVVYDKDHQTSKDTSQKKVSDEQSKAIEDAINSSLGKSVVMMNDIEEELGFTRVQKSGKAYVAIQNIEDATYKLPTKFKAKIKGIYAG